MTQVSHKYIRQDKLEMIFELFFNLISRIDNRREAENILSEILTSTEKIMLAKRIACFYLLSKGVSIVEIAEVLKLSTSTVIYIKHSYNNSAALEKYFNKVLLNEKIKNTLEDIFVELFYGIPRKGSNWEQDKKIYYEYKRKRQEPI